MPNNAPPRLHWIPLVGLAASVALAVKGVLEFNHGGAQLVIVAVVCCVASLVRIFLYRT